MGMDGYGWMDGWMSVRWLIKLFPYAKLSVKNKIIKYNILIWRGRRVRREDQGGDQESQEKRVSNLIFIA
jgi:hypothetical protein